MYARWFQSLNWGDAVNPILIIFLSGQNPTYLSMSKFRLKNRFFPKPVYLVCGSILAYADKNTIIWGPGFGSSDNRLKEKPKKILAVRGPLSRQKILDQGYDAPNIFGDPALLFPRFYHPKISKRYKLGIIPHFTDWGDPRIQRFNVNKYILLIDITSGIFNVVDNILSCERVASSSLHGLIVADAYKIPSVWIKIGDKIIGKDFKFNDYFSSIGKTNQGPLLITDTMNIEDLIKRVKINDISLDLDELIEVCPFKSKEL